MAPRLGRQLTATILLNLGNVFAYLFQLVLARSLAPEAYGEFNALFSLTVWASAPCTVVQFMIAKQAVMLSIDRPAALRTLLWQGLGTMTATAAAVAGLGVALAPLLADYLNLTDRLPVLLTALLLASTLIYPVVMGGIQGLGRYLTLGVGLSSVPFFRFAGGLALVTGLGGGLEGALTACILSSFGGLLIGLPALRGVLRQPGEALPAGTWAAMARDSWPLLLATLLVMTMGNLDMVMVRHYCPPTEAGFYATASVLGRTAFLLPSVLINILFPEAVRTQHAGGDGDRLLLRALAATAVLGGGVAAVCTVCPELILTLLMGSAYGEAANLLVMLSWAMALLAVANTVFVHCLACHRIGFLAVLAVGVSLTGAAITVWHDSAVTIARLLLIAISGLLLATLAWYALRGRTPRPQ